jgi:hypothetical protein
MKELNRLIFSICCIGFITFFSCSKKGNSIPDNPLESSDSLYSKKMESLQKKLDDKQKSIESSAKEMQKIRYHLQSEELTLIRKRIDEFERYLLILREDQVKYKSFLQRDLPSLFLKEREALTSIIQSTQGLDKEAQGILDRILRLITHLNNSAIAQAGT